jgi:DNA-binding NtrC family response regulator
MPDIRNSASGDRTERGPLPTGPTASRLLVVAGDGTWSAHELPTSGTLTLGRGREAGVRIDERAVSRVHARLDIAEDGRFTLTDLGSANGTAVGTSVIRSQTVEVKPGEPLLFGQTVVVIQVPVPERANAGEPERSEPRPAPLSASMASVEALLVKIAPTLVNVLVVGETGVGKDVLAERLHQLSTRASGPFLRLNCAGLTPALLESELFGHEKGAFTGAVQTKKGLLEIAQGGTVLLDEIGEMPLEVQAKLLLALEQRVVRRLGATQTTAIDVRFVCATHRDLEAEMRRERFRADFYFRINGVTIRIPPLRERLEELDGLVARFAQDVSERSQLASVPRFDAEALGMLRAYAWPGNIRELRNVVERAVILSDGERVGRKELRLAELPETGANPGLIGADDDPERRRVVAALAECGGNQSRAAKLLGISRNTLIARIRELGLARPRGG